MIKFTLTLLIVLSILNTLWIVLLQHTTFSLFEHQVVINQQQTQINRSFIDHMSGRGQ